MEKWSSDIHKVMRQENAAVSPITISLCMIVKNEEQTLARCLNSVRDAVDEIVIVDTGSADRTKEIAKLFTDRVLDFEWIDDFAAARNYAFDQATMEYILWLDADDVFLPDERDKLIALKQSLDRSLDAVSMIYHCAFDDAGQVSLSVRRFRLVRREKGMRWVGAVHEDLEVSGNIMDTDIIVTHRKEEARTDRNLRIFEKLVARGTKLTPRDLFHYARELHVNGKYGQAVKIYQQFLEHGGVTAEDHIFVCGALADCYHQLGDAGQEMDWAFRSFRYDVPRPQFCCRIGYHFLQRNELYKAIYWYQRALDAPPPANQWAIDNVPSRTWLPHMQLALCYFRLGNYVESYRQNQLALAYRPGDEQILSNMALCRELLKCQTTAVVNDAGEKSSREVKI